MLAVGIVVDSGVPVLVLEVFEHEAVALAMSVLAEELDKIDFHMLDRDAIHTQDVSVDGVSADDHIDHVDHTLDLDQFRTEQAHTVQVNLVHPDIVHKPEIPVGIQDTVAAVAVVSVAAVVLALVVMVVVVAVVLVLVAVVVVAVVVVVVVVVVPVHTQDTVSSG